jgi:hypothetical protein
VIHHGALTLERRVGVRATAADMMIKASLSRLLVDRHDADLAALGTMHTHESALPFASRLRIAVVVRRRIGKIRFWRNVARNRGVNLRVFLDPSEARQWLVQED